MRFQGEKKMDTNFKLSPYQENILKSVKMGNGNILVDAKAGSGKTSTLLLISNALFEQGKKCLFLAFNKSIVEELEQKVNNPNCTIKTIHSMGMSFIKSYLYRKHNTNYKLEIDNSKLRNIVKIHYNKICFEKVCEENKDLSESDLKELHNQLIGDLCSMINFSRFYNVNYKQYGSTDWLINKCCWYLNRHMDEMEDIYQQVIINSLDDTKWKFEHPDTDENGVPVYYIDYTDMLYFPVYYDMRVPYSLKEYLDCILVDESQDLSVLQQLFVSKLDNGRNRFIFVGDTFQSIYGFAGADTKSINRIKKNFVLEELPLNICYRCPERVVRLAQDIVPSIEWNKSREDRGKLEFIDREQMESILQPGDIILGRKNKDLVELYTYFTLKKKKSVRFRNKELVNKVVKEVEFTIKDYIRYYNKGLNVDVQVKEHMKEFQDKTGFKKKSSEYKKEEKQFKRQCADDNLYFKNISKSNHSLDYLKECMLEYKEKGAYSIDEHLTMTEYYSVIEEFIQKYEEENSSVLVRNLIDYISNFLQGNLYSNVPELSTVHSMKGGEGDNVFILDYPKFPYHTQGGDDEEQQEINLQYVAITRAKKNLYLVEIPIIDFEKQSKDIEANSLCKSTVNLINKINSR